MKRLSIIIFCIGLVVESKAQSELTLPFMSSIFQSSYINPTIIPEHNTSIGLPGMSSVYGQFISNGFLPKNIISFRNDTAHISPTNLLKDLGDKNLLYAGSSVDILHLRLRIRNGYYWIGIRNNATVSFQYPKDFMALALEGNAPYIGKSLDLTNLDIDATVYNEYSFGMAKEYNRWIFGGRISFLQGITNVQFNSKNLNIQIDSSMYANTINADAHIRVAGAIPDFVTFNNPFEINIGGSAPHPKIIDFKNPDIFNNIDSITNILANFKNKGVSLSAGVTYKLNDKLNFSFSFYDLGFINWAQSPTTFSIKGQSRFSGIDMLTTYLNGSSDFKVDSVLNSILNDFQKDSVSQTYRTYLHPKFYSSVSYKIFARTTIGFSASGVYNKKFYPAYTLGLSQGVGRFFNLLGTISYNQRTLKNLGVGIIIKPGPFQIYAILDNVYPAISPLYATNVNVRVGVNFVFGRIKPSVGLPYR